MITHYTLLSHLEDGTHRIMRGLRLTKAKAESMTRDWNKENAGRKDTTRYTVLEATDYCA